MKLSNDTKAWLVVFGGCMFVGLLAICNRDNPTMYGWKNWWFVFLNPLTVIYGAIYLLTKGKAG